MCKVFHSSLILHQEAGSSEPASCIFNTYKGLSQFLIETAPFLFLIYWREYHDKYNSTYY
ncbi:hypothetical protein SAMN04490355_10301 [Pelosinus propionicus DSM 13327]|uniref:Uncharacterized protein n=1 Tax=Pelosinus propionicus DSM 13327 TaxID=1123291 RepID=A0A1I4M627_9FIRM|nr:hypothetical protein SAMN04490355_10301 [Pelosinus propionicus DSM 13327]